jgi:hypothetical protein
MQMNLKLLNCKCLIHALFVDLFESKMSAFYNTVESKLKTLRTESEGNTVYMEHKSFTTPIHAIKMNYFVYSSELNFCYHPFICLFVCFVYSHLSNFSAIRRLSPLPVTGLQI